MAPAPTDRTPIRPARGPLAALQANLAELRDGEITWAEDQNRLYVKEGTGAEGVLTPAGVLGGGDESTLLGSYDASTSEIAALSAVAAQGGRSGFVVGGKISAGSGQQSGDRWVVSKAGTPIGDASSILVPLQANDALLWTGVSWVVISSGVATGAASIHGATDVSDTTVSVVPPADIKGALVRDNRVGDGLPGAYKLVALSAIGGSGLAVISGTAPTSPENGQLWWQPGSQVLSLYYDADEGDGTPGAWLQVVTPEAVGAATTAALGVVRLADSAAITAGTAGRVVDAAQLKAAAAPDATTSSKGLVRLADGAAIVAGTAGRIVDAAQLKAATPDATTEAQGLVRLADSAAITAGTAGRVVDAAQLLAAMVAQGASVSASAPGSPVNGQLWWDTDIDELLIWVDPDGAGGTPGSWEVVTLAATTAADQALSTANAAQSAADSAVSTASAASSTADGASTAATAAQSSAATALSAAQAADGKAVAAQSAADAAQTAADAAQADADAGLAQANSAYNKAVDAETAATNAASTASSASSTANTAIGNAGTALSTAQTAQSTATTAQSTANAAQTAATAAQTTANQALSRSGGTITGEVVFGPGATLSFEGATDNSFETSFSFDDPTADRVINFQNASGTVPLLNGSQTYSGANSFINPGGQTFRGSAAWDGIRVVGGSGGTSSFFVSLATDTLSGNRTLTAPNTTGTIITTGDTGTVTSAMILNNTIVDGDIASNAAINYGKLNLANSIVNADISAGAAIADTKLATISTAGKVSGTAITSGNISTTDSIATTSTVAVGRTSAAANTDLDVNGAYAGNVVAVAALAIDCSAGNYFTKTITTNSTFTFSNVPASRAYSFTLEVTHTGGTITWPASVKWPRGELAPVLTTGKTHLLMFVTDDGGTSWRGAALPNYTN